MRTRGYSFFVVVGSTLALILAASTVHAQDPTGNAAGQAAAAPAPAGFTGSVTVGASLESGRTDLSAVQISFQAQKPNSRADTLTMAASFTHATSQRPGRDDRFTVADRLDANIGIEHNFGDTLVMMVRTQGVRDPIAQIDYRIEQLFGLGARLGTGRVRVRIIPGFSVLSHDKNIATENGFNTNYGFYQDTVVTMTPAWTFRQFILASRDVSDQNDHVISASAQLTGAITRRLGIQLSYQYSFESLLPPGVESQYQKALAGLQVSF